MTTIYLVRHAEAEGNAFRRFHGQYDSLLTPRGCEQTAYLRERFTQIPVDACFSSDLTRACMTARAIFEPKRLPLRRDRRLREVDVGVWEDIPFGNLYQSDEARMRAFNRTPTAWAVDGAERYAQYTGRFLSALTETAQRFEGGSIAVVSHGAVMRGTLARLFFGGDVSALPYSENTGVSLLHYEAGGFTYEFLNDASHLPERLRRNPAGTDGDLCLASADSMPLAPELMLEPDGGGRLFVAIRQNTPIGVISLGAPQGDTGVIRAMRLLDEARGGDCADQLLGCAFSDARAHGCTRLRALPGEYPDGLLTRYGFDAATLERSIDTHIFDWGDAL